MGSGSLLQCTIGEYRLVDFLGAGGMGDVYRGVHLKIGRVVAIKVLSRHDRTTAVLERFQNEARIQAALSHPNVAVLYDFLEFQGHPCIIMEYVDGESLEDRIRRCGRLRLAEAAPLLQTLADAVGYVHERGIVHRDLKPTNVRINSAGVVKLLDFGIARSAATPRLTMAGNVIGTLLYLSPEQLTGGEATPRSDIWSLGVVFYEMLSGRVPFEATTVTEFWDKVNKGEYPRLSSLQHLFAGEDRAGVETAGRIVARCLQKEPGARYESARDLQRDLSTLRGGAPERSAPVPVPHPGRPGAAFLALIERYWKVLAAAAAVFLLLLIFFPGGPEDNPRGGGNPKKQDSVPAGPIYRIELAEGSAEVYINGVLRGSTPFDYAAPAGQGEIDLELRRSGYRTVHERFDITKKKVWTFAMARSGN